ncbi:MAG: GAF domain-containing protein, partial [Anaerolineae bacterium]
MTSPAPPSPSPAPPTPPLKTPLPPDISISHAFAQISATVLDLDDVLGTALDILAHAFNFDLLSIILVDDASNELQLKAYKSPHPVGILEAAYPAVLEAVEEGQVVKKTALTAGHGPVARLSSLVLPLTIGRLVTGALVVGDSQATTFSPQDEQILAIFASQLTVAITNVRLYQKSREQQQQELIRRQIATHLQQLSTIINASLEPDEVLNSILEHIAIVIPYSKALIMLLQGHNLVVHAAAGAAGDVIDMAVNVTEQTFYQQILLQQYPAVFHNITHDNPLTTEPVRFTEDTTAWIGAPLVIKDKLVGLLTLHHTEPGYFDDADLDLVHTFANQAAIAIDNAQLYHREQQKAKQFQTVAKIGRQATEIREVQLLLDTVVKRLHQDLGYEYVTMFLYQNQTDSLMLKAASDIPPEKIDAASRPISLDGPGILSTAGRTEQAILVNDINAFSGYYPGPGRDTVQSELAIPLISQEKLIGVLDFQSRRSHAFSPDDLTLAQAVADHMAVVIETANLFEERDQRMAELIAFNQIGIAIADPTNLDGTLASILERIKALYQVEGTSLMLLEGETLHFQIAVGVPEEVLKPFSLKLGEGFAGWVAQHNSPLRVDDVSKDPRHYKTIDQSINFKTRALLAVPVQIQGRVLGVIEVINRLDGKKFTRDDEVILSFIASAMAITIENSRLLANVTQKANQMAGLFEASQALTDLNLDKVLQITIRQA